MITAKYLVESELDYCDLYLIEALKDLYDEDIRNFINLYIKLSTSQNGPAMLCGYSDKERVSLEKLQNLNIFGRDRTLGRFDDKQKPLFYEQTEVSQRLFSYYNSLKSAYD